MNWVLGIILVGLLAILVWAYWKPDSMPNIWETTLGDSWVLIVGVLTETLEFLNSMPEFKDFLTVSFPKYSGLLLMGIGVLMLFLRRINIGRTG